MNRRLFVGQLIAGASLLSTPASLIARSVAPSSSKLSGRSLAQKAIDWTQNGSIGSLQHITLSHVYNPKHTSLSALMAMVHEDMTTVNTLLGTDFVVANQPLFSGKSAAFGTYTAQFEKAGVRVTWQGLAHIGSDAKQPTARLRMYGSQGIIQVRPDSDSCQLVNLQGKVTELGGSHYAL